MNLTPSERAVLGQIRTLFEEGSISYLRVKVLHTRWPVVHFESYKQGYIGLVQKGLIEETADGLSYRITDAGFRAMGKVPLSN